MPRLNTIIKFAIISVGIILLVSAGILGLDHYLSIPDSLGYFAFDAIIVSMVTALFLSLITMGLLFFDKSESNPLFYLLLAAIAEFIIPFAILSHVMAC